jgi:hypothetical protein
MYQPQIAAVVLPPLGQTIGLGVDTYLLLLLLLLWLLVGRCVVDTWESQPGAANLVETTTTTTTRAP